MKDKSMVVKLVVYEGVGHDFPPEGSTEVKKVLRCVEATKWFTCRLLDSETKMGIIKIH